MNDECGMMNVKPLETLQFIIPHSSFIVHHFGHA